MEEIIQMYTKLVKDIEGKIKDVNSEVNGISKEITTLVDLTWGQYSEFVETEGEKAKLDDLKEMEKKIKDSWNNHFNETLDNFLFDLQSVIIKSSEVSDYFTKKKDMSYASKPGYLRIIIDKARILSKKPGEESGDDFNVEFNDKINTKDSYQVKVEPQLNRFTRTGFLEQVQKYFDEHESEFPGFTKGSEWDEYLKKNTGKKFKTIVMTYEGRIGGLFEDIPKPEYLQAFNKEMPEDNTSKLWDLVNVYKRNKEIIEKEFPKFKGYMNEVGKWISEQFYKHFDMRSQSKDKPNTEDVLENYKTRVSGIIDEMIAKCPKLLELDAKLIEKYPSLGKIKEKL